MSFSKFYLPIILSLLWCSLSIAQRETVFEPQQKMYVKGNSILIGNTVLGKHPEYDFNDLKTLNDQLPLVLIDVDNDPETYSSSEASFSLTSGSQKIKYAALYWGGLYPAQRSTRRKGKRKMKYKHIGERSPDVENILFKINNEEYTSIIGQKIFDSEGKGPYSKESPYSCFADVTSHLVDKTGNITATVANIKATTGYIEGGAAAGWLLYIIYEDDTLMPKYFTSYTGFNEVSKDEIEIVFDGLQPKEGTTSTSKILMATLEGDTKIKGDACSIYNEAEDKFIPLKDDTRAPLNFFNSTISTGHDVNQSRKPASQNTLGIDILKLDIPDDIITATTTQTTIQLSTKQDRFYTFFLAFETEIENAILLENQEKIAMTTAAKATVIEQTVENTATRIDTITKANQTITVALPQTRALAQQEVAKTETSKTEIETNNSAPLTTAQETAVEKELALRVIEERASVPAKGMIAGYYLVTNVFTEEDNALNWKNKLNAEGYNGRIFKNSETNMIYVYVESSTNVDIMQDRKEILRQIPHLKNSWVCRVNL